MTHMIKFLLLLPRNLCVVILRAYRAVISPLYGDVCRYYPSCSAYALRAIQIYGVTKGVWLGSLRIARCHPWALGGVDDVPERTVAKYRITRFGFVTSVSAGQRRSALDPQWQRSDSLISTPHRFHLSHSQGKG